MNTEALTWLATVSCVSISVSRNDDHAANYTTARAWIEDHAEEFEDDDPAEVERMKASGMIWTLQVYPQTPIGSFTYHAASLAQVIDDAMRDERAGEWK